VEELFRFRFSWSGGRLYAVGEFISGAPAGVCGAEALSWRPAVGFRRAPRDGLERSSGVHFDAAGGGGKKGGASDQHQKDMYRSIETRPDGLW